MKEIKTSEFLCGDKTKTMWADADKQMQEDLYMLSLQKKYAEYKKKQSEKINKFHKPIPDDSAKKYLVFSIKKTVLEKLARFHYFIEFLFVAILCYLYYSKFGLEISNLFIFIPLAVVVVVTLIYFITNLICSIRIQTYIDSLSTSKYVCLRMGEPSTGKSSSGIYEAIEKSKKLWEELQFEYWLISEKIERIYSGTRIEHKVLGKDENGNLKIDYKRVYSGDKAKIKHAIEIVESYEYYSSHNCIPCFWSNIPVFVDGKPANIFTTDHLLQNEKILYKGIAFIDEIGSMLPPQLSLNKNEMIDLMFRFCRHFTEWHIISTEQDGSATLISARRVTAENRRMIEQKHILKPFILDWVTKVIKKVIQHFKGTDERVRFISNLRYYVDSVGFRKFKYEDYGNLQVGNKGEVSSRVKAFMAPPHLNCFYDDRTFRNLYKCINQCANVQTFSNAVLSLEEIKKLFNRELLDKAYKKTKRTYAKTNNQEQVNEVNQNQNKEVA